MYQLSELPYLSPQSTNRVLSLSSTPRVGSPKDGWDDVLLRVSLPEVLEPEPRKNALKYLLYFGMEDLPNLKYKWIMRHQTKDQR